MQGNKLCGTVPPQLTALSALSASTLSFANNQLYGALPTAVAAVFPANLSLWSGNCVVNASVGPGCSLSERPALLDLCVRPMRCCIAVCDWLLSLHVVDSLATTLLCDLM